MTIAFLIILVLLFVLRIVMGIFMQPKSQDAIDKSFSETSLSAPKYHTMTLKSGKKIGYITAPNPNKPVFLMLHGSPGSSTDFLNYFKNEYLRSNYEMISIDRLGFGKSDPHAEPSIQKQSDAIAECISTLGLLDRKLIGFSHSYGVPIMVNVSRQHPDWFTYNIFAGGANDAENEKTFFFNPIFKYLKCLLPQPVSNSNDEKLSHADQLKIIASSYHNYDLPSVFIHGKKDKLVDFKNQEFVKNNVTSPNVKFMDIEDKGHIFPLMNVEYTIDLIKPYLE